MVAYSFKARFKSPIRIGTKGGTIRNDRKRHARPGEELQLYHAMRTTQCELITRKTCLGVAPIRLDLREDTIDLAGEPMWSIPRRLDAFARFDGFDDWADLKLFWLATHDVLNRYSGVHIRWLPWPKELLP